tara:strand:+ start:469 stop:1077 length:609 start_codon:yes stop_codon:yes gene_type:complete
VIISPDKIGVATLISIALSALVFFSACQWVENGYPPPTFIASRDCEDLNREVLTVTDLFISKSNGERDITLQVEVADEPSKRKQGLMCRESIPSGTGMLFTYNSDRSSGFWMYNTYTSIDILFIDSSGQVADMIKMSPCPRETIYHEDDDEWRKRCMAEAQAYVPSRSWRSTLELPAGWLSKQSLDDPVKSISKIVWSTPTN